MAYKKALIDGDVIVYRAAFSAQTQQFDVVNKDGDVLETFTNKRSAKALLDDLKLFGGDTDGLDVVKGGQELKPLKEVYKYVDDLISDIVYDAGCKTSRVFLSGENNFRNGLAVTKKYKGNRKQDKPKYYKQVRDYLLSEHKAETTTEDEADDALAIAQTANIKGTVICTIDKDLWTVAGAKYDFRRKEKSNVTEAEGLEFFQYQMMVGDTVDNIQGVKGTGSVGARRLLAISKNSDESWISILDLYEKAYGEDYLNVFLEMGRLLHMRRYEGEMWWYPDVIVATGVVDKEYKNNKEK